MERRHEDYEILELPTAEGHNLCHWTDNDSLRILSAYCRERCIHDNKNDRCKVERVASTLGRTDPGSRPTSLAGGSSRPLGHESSYSINGQVSQRRVAGYVLAGGGLQR